MIQRWLQRRRERKIIQALTLLAFERISRMTSEEILLKSRPADCYGDDCSKCECDFGPDCD